MNNKYAILVGDGMADYGIPEIGNKTPLEYANTPNMDSVSRNGLSGLVSTVPDGFAPGSDVANLSLMGYDPVHFYSGRAPIEAISMGIKLSKQDMAFRCNLVTIDNGIMADYSAGHIETQDACKLIDELQKNLGSDKIKFYCGVGYRHILIIGGFPDGLSCTPPHDITDKKTSSYMPKGPQEETIISIMHKAKEILNHSEINKQRISAGKKPATDIWLWGQGHAVSMPTMKERYNITGSVISAVDLIRGLGILAGLQVRIVDGATGYLDTNYRGKVDAAFEALKNEDLVYLHIEAPDETSHEGSLQKKITAIEEFDHHIVGEFLKFQKECDNLRILIAPDHATPVSLKTHSSDPVPYTICGTGITKDEIFAFCEKSVINQEILTGTSLFDKLIKS